MKKIILLFCISISLVSLKCDRNSEAKTIQFKGISYDLFRVNTAQEQVQFHWKNEDGGIYKNFKNLKQSLASKDKKLRFAINGGIYDKGNIPKGLYIENGRKLSPIDLQKGKGNFYLKPNGIFVIYDNQQVAILPSEAYEQLEKEGIKNALQSGPLLVNRGLIHAKLSINGTSKYLRAGVGMIDDNNLVFAISNQPVNLYDFAALFQQELNCSVALYLDGAICKMYLPELGRKQMKGNFATMIGLVEND